MRTLPTPPKGQVRRVNGRPGSRLDSPIGGEIPSKGAFLVVDASLVEADRERIALPTPEPACVGEIDEEDMDGNLSVEDEGRSSPAPEIEEDILFAAEPALAQCKSDPEASNVEDLSGNTTPTHPKQGGVDQLIDVADDDKQPSPGLAIDGSRQELLPGTDCLDMDSQRHCTEPEHDTLDSSCAQSQSDKPTSTTESAMRNDETDGHDAVQAGDEADPCMDARIVLQARDEDSPSTNMPSAQPQTGADMPSLHIGHRVSEQIDCGRRPPQEPESGIQPAPESLPSAASGEHAQNEGEPSGRGHEGSCAHIDLMTHEVTKTEEAEPPGPDASQTCLQIPFDGEQTHQESSELGARAVKVDASPSIAPALATEFEPAKQRDEAVADSESSKHSDDDQPDDLLPPAPKACDLRADVVTFSCRLQMAKRDEENLRGVMLGEKEAASIAHGLRHNSKITSLDLSDSSLTPAAASVLASTLGTSSVPVRKLSKLVLARCPVGDTAAESLFQCLHRLPLETLDMRCSLLSPVSGEALARAVAESPLGRLRALNLGGNSLLSTGVRALAPSLPLLTALQTLVLDGNGIDDPGAAALAEALGRSASLAALLLPNNEISAVGGQALVGAYKARKETRMRVLDLAGNRIQGDAAVALERMGRPALRLSSMVRQGSLR